MLVHHVEVHLKDIFPETVWQWLADMNKAKYLRWHKDHKDYALLSTPGTLLGSRIVFDEDLEGQFRINFSWEVTECQEGKKLTFRARLPYPVILEIGLSPRDGGTLVTHRLSIGVEYRIASALDELIARTYFSQKRRDLLKRHVFEEFHNLAVLAKQSPSAIQS